MGAVRLVAVMAVLSTACGAGGVPTREGAPAPSAAERSSSTTGEPGEATASRAPDPPPAAPAWQRRAPAPTARQEVASTVADGRIWVIGGLAATGATAAVETYDPGTDRWAAGPDLPVALHHAAATTYRGEVVVVGGFLAAGSLYARPSDRVLALRAGAWVDLPPLRRPRGAAAAAVAGGVLVVAGGRDSSALVGPTELFDGAGWRDGAPVLTRRDHLSAASDGRSMFTVGGRFLQPGALSAALERYDPAADAWERLPAMPTARGGQGAALAGSRLVVVGGEDPGGVYAEVEAYDLVTQQWSGLAPLPTPRHGLSVEHVAGQVLALVGGTAFGVAPSAAAEGLSPLS